MSQLGLLPVMLVILTGGAFILSYIWAVARGDVSAAFPYISDTGADRPESSIFGQLLNMSAFVAFFIMYIRYKAVQAIVRVSDGEESAWLRRMNVASMVLGMVAAFGVSIVANFQEGSAVESVHFVGAALAFGPGVLYCFFSTALSFHMYPRFNGMFICRLRLMVSLLCVVAFTIMMVSGLLAFHRWHGNPHSPDKFKWKPEDPGFTCHILSTVFEWVLAFGFFCFFLTYTREFNKFEMEVVARPLVAHLDHPLDDSVQVSRGQERGGREGQMEGHANLSYQQPDERREPDERSKLLG